MRTLRSVSISADVEVESFGCLFKRVFHVQHILLRVVVHVADRADVVVELGDAKLFRREHGGRFGAGPGEVIAVVVEVDVGVLRGVEAAALAIG